MPFPDSKYPSVLRGYDERTSQRLWAAAPAMLEALKMLVPTKSDGSVLCYCEDFRRSMTAHDPEARCDYCVAMDAIRKAEGRTVECR